MTVLEAIQQIYDSIARRSRELTYLNFGFADETTPPGAGDHAELQSLGRRLYETVLGPLPKEGRVLEIACGRGGGARFLLEQHPGLRYVGLDLSPEHARACRDRFATEPRAQFAVADATRLPLPDACFDAAVSIEACHHFESLDAFYREVRRVLRPGGVLRLAGIWEAEQAGTRPFEAAGFEILERTDITAGVVESLRRTSPLRKELVEALQFPERFLPFLMSWAGAEGSGSFRELAARERLYLRYRLARA